ncbi:hypothetical protein [Microbacterium sp. Se5.02b]|uniref:hypothetical protein n=1 Tax=Microbacterium sp. Se5.02b TaxID=2864103 RepID=UPI00215D9BEA|nr:hypothetical protein [Microbacterium sp. Se5.02b]
MSFAQGIGVAIWPGAGLSLAWAGLVGAALVTLDTAITLPRLRALATVVAAVALGICAVPALTAFHTERSVLANGPESTLPAYVAAQAAGDRDIATLVLTPQNDGGLAVEAVWGASETLGSQSTMISTAVEPQGADISTLAVDLLSARDFDAPGELAAAGISYVLVAQIPAAKRTRPAPSAPRRSHRSISVLDSFMRERPIAASCGGSRPTSTSPVRRASRMRSRAPLVS